MGFRGLLTAGQGILEDLLEAQELQNGQIDRGVKSKTAFVRTKSGIELHPVSTVDLDLALVIFPDTSELDDALGDGGDLESFLVFWVLFEEGGVLKRAHQFCPVSAIRPPSEKTVGFFTLVGLLELGLRREVRHVVCRNTEAVGLR